MSLLPKLIAGFVALVISGGVSEAAGAPKVKVVASFSILGDLVQQVGGDRVTVTTLVGPNGDAHVYQPTPAAAKAVGAAHLVVVNGLGFEGWMERLIKTSGFQGPVVVASQGVQPREMSPQDKEPHGSGSHHHHHQIDPHAWQSLSNVAIYVNNIARGLAAVDPPGAAAYQANAAAYQAKLQELDHWAQAEFAAIPPEKRRMITSHDALGYFGAAYGLTIIAALGVNTESEAAAGEIAKIIRLIRAEKISAVFLENVTDPRLMQQIARESGAALGGSLYSDALSEPSGPAPTFIDMFKHNLTQIVAAMRCDP